MGAGGGENYKVVPLVSKNLQFILTFFVTALLIVTCACGEETPTLSEAKVGEAIWGTYTITYAFFESENIGDLALSNNTYLFTPKYKKNKNWDSNIIDFFIENPTGSVDLGYYSSINENTELESLEDSKNLIYFTFASANDSVPQTSFILSNDKYRKQLYFHSVVSDIQLWHITKPWEEM